MATNPTPPPEVKVPLPQPANPEIDKQLVRPTLVYQITNDEIGDAIKEEWKEGIGRAPNKYRFVQGFFKTMKRMNNYKTINIDANSDFIHKFEFVSANHFLPFINSKGHNFRLHSAGKLPDFQNISATATGKIAPATTFLQKNQSKVQFLYNFPLNLFNPSQFSMINLFSTSRIDLPNASLVDVISGVQFDRPDWSVALYMKSVLEGKDGDVPKSFALRWFLRPEGVPGLNFDLKVKLTTLRSFSHRFSLTHNYRREFGDSKQPFVLRNFAHGAWGQDDCFKFDEFRPFYRFEESTERSDLVLNNMTQFGWKWSILRSFLSPFLFTNALVWKGRHGLERELKAGLGIDLFARETFIIRLMVNLVAMGDSDNFLLKFVYSD